MDHTKEMHKHRRKDEEELKESRLRQRKNVFKKGDLRDGRKGKEVLVVYIQ